MTTHLEKYIDRKNGFARITGQNEIGYPPKGAEINRVYDMLDCDLSPENLHCDGEITRAAAAKKARKLHAAMKELNGLVS